MVSCQDTHERKVVLRASLWARFKLYVWESLQVKQGRCRTSPYSGRLQLRRTLQCMSHRFHSATYTSSDISCLLYCFPLLSLFSTQSHLAILALCPLACLSTGERISGLSSMISLLHTPSFTQSVAFNVSFSEADLVTLCWYPISVRICPTTLSWFTELLTFRATTASFLEASSTAQ